MLLSAVKLCKQFDGLIAVDEVDLQIRPGTMNALIGPNGAGKTTVFNMICGFSDIRSGEVYFRSVRITNLPPYRIAKMGISRTFQNTRLFPQITVLENMLVATEYEKGESLVSALLQPKVMKDEDRRNRLRAMEHLQSVGLGNKRDVLAQNLSHGERRLLELARALVTGAELFLLDEPTAGVFPITKARILDILRGLRAEGKTIVFIEHDMKVVSELCDNVIVLNYGKKIAEGPPEEIVRDTQVREAYMGRRSYIVS